MLTISTNQAVNVSAMNCRFSNSATSVFNFAGSTSNSYKLFLSDCIASGNTARTGAVAYFENNGDQSITATNTSFENNSATLSGGVFFLDGSYQRLQNVQLVNCTFLNNTADSFGGAIHLHNANQTVNVTQSEIHNNRVTNTTQYGSVGSGAFLYSSGGGNQTILFYGVNITGNSATFGGGVFYGDVTQSEVTMEQVTAKNNFATTWNGGFAVLGGDNQSLTVVNSSTYNHSATSGGVFYLYSPTSFHQSMNLTQCNMTSNMAGQGGVLYCQASEGLQQFILTSSVLNLNNGGACVIESAPNIHDVTLVLADNLFEDNSAELTGYSGGVYVNNARHVTLQSNIWRNNSAVGSGHLALGMILGVTISLDRIITINNETFGAVRNGSNSFNLDAYDQNTTHIEVTDLFLESSPVKHMALGCSKNCTLNITSLYTQGMEAALLDFNGGGFTVTHLGNLTVNSSHPSQLIFMDYHQTMAFEQVDYPFSNTSEVCYGAPQSVFGGNSAYRVVLPAYPCRLSVIPYNATGNTTLVGNQPLLANEVLNVSTQAQIHVVGCVTLEGQLNLTVTPDAFPGRHLLLETTNTCLNGTFSEFHFYLQDNPRVCSVELEYSSSSVFTYLTSCETLTHLPDGATGNITLYGNQTLAANQTLTMSTQLQINVDGCVKVDGRLNLTIKADAEVGKQALVTTREPCFSGTFSEFHYELEDHPDGQPSVCSAQLEYTSSAVFASLVVCPSPFPVGAVVGGVIGGVAFIALVIIVVVFVTKRQAQIKASASVRHQLEAVNTS